jgi:hypothetical protein
MYDPQMGKFFSPDLGGVKTADATKPMTWNRYLYANGDPLNHRDTQGLASVFLDGADDTNYGYGDESGCDNVTTKLLGNPDPCDVSNIAYYEPEIEPDPAPVVAACSMYVDTTPGDIPSNQNIVGTTPTAPTSNRLGPYQRTWPDGDYRLSGYAFQVENLVSGPPATAWNYSQTVQTLGGAPFLAIPHDDKLSYKVTYWDNKNGVLDWLDAPYIPKANGTSTFNFDFFLAFPTWVGCHLSLSLTVAVKNGNASWTVSGR